MRIRGPKISRPDDHDLAVDARALCPEVVRAGRPKETAGALVRDERGVGPQPQLAVMATGRIETGGPLLGERALEPSAKRRHDFGTRVTHRMRRRVHTPAINAPLEPRICCRVQFLRSRGDQRVVERGSAPAGQWLGISESHRTRVNPGAKDRRTRPSRRPSHSGPCVVRCPARRPPRPWSGPRRNAV